MKLPYFDDVAVEAATPYPDLIAAIGEAFRHGGVARTTDNKRHLCTVRQPDQYAGCYISGDLYQLAATDGLARQTGNEITVFKSVGSGLEDLAAAILCMSRETGSAPGRP